MTGFVGMLAANPVGFGVAEDITGFPNFVLSAGIDGVFG